jgi:predicted ATP-grasp superfamily ATP-dependent carboligase
LTGPANRFLRALGYDGFSCIEFKKDSRDGRYRLMEINARLNLSTPLSVLAGVNFPYLLYRHVLVGEKPPPIAGFREEVYWVDPGKDLAESLRSYWRERFSLPEYLRPYLKPHVLTIPSMTDPGPFLKRSYDLVVESARRACASLLRRSV